MTERRNFYDRPFNFLVKVSQDTRDDLDTIAQRWRTTRASIVKQALREFISRNMISCAKCDACLIAAAHDTLKRPEE